MAPLPQDTGEVQAAIVLSLEKCPPKLIRYGGHIQLDDGFLRG